MTTLPLRKILTEDVARQVPGHNAIAGDHSGIDAVLILLPAAAPYRTTSLNDVVSFEVRPASVGRTSLSTTFTVRRDDEVLAVGHTTYVAVFPAGAVPPPDRLRTALRGVPASPPVAGRRPGRRPPHGDRDAAG